MNEFFNWNNSWILVEHNWAWLLLAFAIGAVVGFRYNRWTESR